MFKANPKLKSIFLVGFLAALNLALTAYVSSSYLSTYFSEKVVGLLYSAGFLVSIMALLAMPKMLSKIGSYKFLLSVVGLNAIFLLCLSLFTSVWSIIPVFVGYLTLNTIIVFALDELLQIYSQNYGLGKVRGLYITVLSAAWVIAQTVSGTILNNFSFSVLYFLAFGILTLAFIISFFHLKDSPDPEYDKASIVDSLKAFFKNKNLARAYKFNFLLHFFFAFMVIYTPIYLNAHLGFTWSEIGVIFTVMLTPFVGLPYFLGKYSDKIGERKMLILGFTIASLATFSLFFIKAHSVFIWALLLFMTRVGASAIEVMSDVYFFKHITPANDEFIGIFRNAHPLAYVMAPLVAVLVFTFTPAFNYIFLVLGAIMLSGIYFASTIEKTDI